MEELWQVADNAATTEVKCVSDPADWRFLAIKNSMPTSPGIPGESVSSQKSIQILSELPEITSEVIQRCKEYIKDSSNESDGWDCKTIITTSTLLMLAPYSRRKKMADTILVGPPNKVITLKGK